MYMCWTRVSSLNQCSSVKPRRISELEYSHGGLSATNAGVKYLQTEISDKEGLIYKETRITVRNARWASSQTQTLPCNLSHASLVYRSFHHDHTYTFTFKAAHGKRCCPQRSSIAGWIISFAWLVRLAWWVGTRWNQSRDLHYSFHFKMETTLMTRVWKKILSIERLWNGRCWGRLTAGCLF